MSGCDAPIRVDMTVYAVTEKQVAAILDICAHGEDDPCCSETETPDEPRDEAPQG